MASLAELFRRHHPAVYGYLRRRVGNVADAEELTQEVFLRAHRAWGRYAQSGRDEAWIFRIARNVLLNFHRDTARSRRIERDTHPADVESSKVRDAQVRIDLERALARLPESEAEAFLLKEIGGLSYEEIARLTRSTADAIRNRIFRARRTLCEAFSAPSDLDSR